VRVDEPERDEASVAWLGWVLEFEGGDPVVTAWQILLARRCSTKEPVELFGLRNGEVDTYNTFGKASRRPCRVSALP
jgi:hypothetical protein